MSKTILKKEEIETTGLVVAQATAEQMKKSSGVNNAVTNSWYTFTDFVLR